MTDEEILLWILFLLLFYWFWFIYLVFLAFMLNSSFAPHALVQKKKGTFFILGFSENIFQSI